MNMTSMTVRNSPKVSEPILKVFAAAERPYYLMTAMPHQAHEIFELVNGAKRTGGEVIEVSEQQISGWIASGLSFVVVDPITGKVIGHKAFDEWPKGDGSTAALELRSGVVAREFRNYGINGKVTPMMLEKVFSENPGVVLLDVKKGKQGLEMLINEKTGLGFVEIPYEEAHAKYGLEIQDPEAGPWHIYMLTAEMYKSSPFKQIARPIEQVPVVDGSTYTLTQLLGVEVRGGEK